MKAFFLKSPGKKRLFESDMSTSANKTVLRSSLVLSFFMLLAGLLSYLTLVVLAFSFGARQEMDAFFAASTIPQILSSVISAALSSTFIPVFIEARQKDERNAWKVASISANGLFILLCFLAIAGFLFSRSIITGLNPGFSQETSTASADLFRIFLFSQIFSGTSILLTSLFYAQHRFFRPSVALGLNNLMTLFFVVFLKKDLGIKSIALGTLLGSLTQFVLLGQIFTREKRFSLTIDFKKKELVKLARLMWPLLVGAIFYKTNALVERFLASRLTEGSVSYLGYANTIITALLIMLTQGLSTALFPKMSEYAARNDVNGLKEILSKALRVLIMITVPVAFFVGLAKFELVSLIFERGNFTRPATIAVGKTLIAYLGFFVVAAILPPLVNTLYSLQETLIVAAVGIFGFLLYVFIAIILSGHFGYLGIAAASSVQYLISLFVYLALIKIKIDGLDIPVIRRCLLKSLLAGGFAVLLCLASDRWVKASMSPPLHLIILALLGAISYVLALIVFKTDELKLIPLNFSFLGKSRP